MNPATRPLRPGRTDVAPALALLCLLAVAVVAGGATNSEPWFNEGKVPMLQIEIPEKGMQVLRRYQWKWGGNDSERENVSVTVREGTKVYTNVLLHLKGAAGSFRPVDDRPAMTLNFGKEAKGQRFHGLEKISLNNSVQDPSYVCEILARELFLEAGVPTTRAAHAMVQLNNRKLGMYVLVEGWNKAFLKRHFKNTDGNLFEGGFGRDIDQPLAVNSGENPASVTRLKDLTTAARNPDTRNRLKTLDPLLDVERFISFAAMENLLTHTDGYCIGHNNYRVFHDAGSDRFVFMPHGMDQLFGKFKSSPEYTLTPGFRSVVSKGALEAQGGRRRYLERIGVLYSNLFTGGRLEARVDAIAARIRPALANSPQGTARWESELKDLKSRVNRRIRSVQEQLLHPAQPQPFGPSGELALRNWSFKQDAQGQGQGERRTDNDITTLTIEGSGQTAKVWPSWRKTILLGAGSYRLSARVRLEGQSTEPQDPVSEIALRVSGVRSGYPRSASAEWRVLRYEFEVEETAEMELVCELRGAKGTALLDARSLKMEKLPPRQTQPPGEAP